LRKLAGKLDIKNADDRIPIKTREAVLESEGFKALWDRIKHKTTYRVEFDNAKLIEDCARAITNGPPITKTRAQFRVADIAIGKGGVEAKETSASGFTSINESDIQLPDLLTDLQDKTQLTRQSLVKLLTESRRLNDFKKTLRNLSILPLRRSIAPSSSLLWTVFAISAWGRNTTTRRSFSSKRSLPAI
jgi:type III restriction enzyme